MSRMLLRATRFAAKPLARVAATRVTALTAAAVRARAAVAAAAPTAVAAPARALATAAGTGAGADPNRAKALIAANAVPKPAVVIAQSVFKSAVLDVPIGVAWDGIRAFAGTWIPDSVIALAPDHKEDGSHNVIGHSRIVTVVPLKKRLVEQLVGYNDLKRSYTYRTLAVEPGIFPAAFWNYVGTVRLYEITEGAKTLATWTANYETAPGPNAAALYAAVGDGTLAANLTAFNQYLTSKYKNTQHSPMAAEATDAKAAAPAAAPAPAAGGAAAPKKNLNVSQATTMAAQALQKQTDAVNSMMAAGAGADAQDAEGKQAEAAQRRQHIVRQILTADAQERLARIALVNPEKARGVEDSLIRLASSGQLAEKVNGDRLKAMLEQAATTKTTTKITFQRKKRKDEEDDEEFDL